MAASRSRPLAVRKPARARGRPAAHQDVEQAEPEHVALALDRGLGQPGGGPDGPPGVGVEGAAALHVDLLALVVPGVGVGRGRARGRAQGEHHGQEHEGGGQVGGQHPGRAGRGAGGPGPGRGAASADGHAHGSLLSRHGVSGGTGPGTGHGQARARLGHGPVREDRRIRLGVARCRRSRRSERGVDRGGEGAPLDLWSAGAGSVARLDFAGPGEVPWSPPLATRGATTRGRRLDERPWYSDFFDDDYLRIFLPMLPE